MAGEEIIIDELVTENNEAMVHSPEWYQRLKTAVDNLIVNDFGRLVQILYRADVPEQKLKRLLRDNQGTDASAIICDLLLERQLQKIEARKMFSGPPPPGDEERW